MRSPRRVGVEIFSQPKIAKKIIYHKVRHPRCVYNKLDWSVCTCLTQLYDGRDMYIIYYIKNNYMYIFIIIPCKMIKM